jgi:glutathione S-transferase
VGIRGNQPLSGRETQVLTLSIDASGRWSNAPVDVFHLQRSGAGIDNSVSESSLLSAGTAERDLGRSGRSDAPDQVAILEQQLAKTPFFGGDRWDMADFMVACVLYTVTRLKLDLAAFPRLDAWLIASINRPAAQVARKLRET